MLDTFESLSFNLCIPNLVFFCKSPKDYFCLQYVSNAVLLVCLQQSPLVVQMNVFFRFEKRLCRQKKRFVVLSLSKKNIFKYVDSQQKLLFPAETMGGNY